MSKIKTVFVVGPTASGKTGLGIFLAKKFGGEVISADSMQIYKGIHIASAAPDDAETDGIPHHLVEFLDTSSQFSVADYCDMAKSKIKEINGRGNLPVIVGGTGLYISSLLNNTEFVESKIDFELREKIEARFDSLGAEKMLEELRKIDPETAERLHPNDRRRIIRAFEVFESTGKTVSEQNDASHNNEGFIEPLVIGITYSDREKLYDRINKRVDLMLKNGLIDEAKQCRTNAKSGGFQAIGHKELYGYLDGIVTLDEAVENLKMQTRRYAKRQLTWFRHEPKIKWIFADCVSDIYCEAENLTARFLKIEGRE